jgi:hypothetical protein
MPSAPPVHRAEHLNVADNIDLELGRDARLDHLDQSGGDGFRFVSVDEEEIRSEFLAANSGIMPSLMR